MFPSNNPFVERYAYLRKRTTQFKVVCVHWCVCKLLYVQQASHLILVDGTKLPLQRNNMWMDCSSSWNEWQSYSEQHRCVWTYGSGTDHLTELETFWISTMFSTKCNWDDCYFSILEMTCLFVNGEKELFSYSSEVVLHRSGKAWVKLVSPFVRGSLGKQ